MRRCGARRKRGGEPCRKPAGWGTDHSGWGSCRLHGGCTPNARKSAQKQIAAAALENYGRPRAIDPQAALLEEVHRTAGHVAWLGAKVAALSEAELVWGVTRETVASGGEGDGSSRVEEARPSVWLVMYNAERRHLLDVCAVAIRAGLAERQVRIQEEQGRLLAQAIQGVLTDLGVADRPDAPAIVRRHLLLVSDASADTRPGQPEVEEGKRP